MQTLESYLISLRNLEINLDKIIDDVIDKNQGKILSILKLRLFNTGVDGDGKTILPTYHPKTIDIKKDKGQITSHVTLRDSGDFYRSMYIENKNDLINIDATVIYKDALVKKYGQPILELTDDEQNFIIFTIIEPEVNKELNKLNNQQIDLDELFE